MVFAHCPGTRAKGIHPLSRQILLAEFSNASAARPKAILWISPLSWRGLTRKILLHSVTWPFGSRTSFVTDLVSNATKRSNQNRKSNHMEHFRQKDRCSSIHRLILNSRDSTLGILTS